MGITTNAVCPEFVKTKMLQDAASQLAEVYGILSGVVDLDFIGSHRETKLTAIDK